MNLFSSVFYFVMLIWFIIGYIFLLYWIGQYAERLGRSDGSWVFVAIVFSPLIAFLGLYMCGETEDVQGKKMIRLASLVQELPKVEDVSAQKTDCQVRELELSENEGGTNEEEGTFDGEQGVPSLK